MVYCAAMRWGVAVALALAVTAAGCGFGKPRPIAPSPGATQEGIASWYGPGFHGRRTANGEIYNQYGFTAAHQTLPHGTRVRVTNLTNNRAVLVRINDRGPFVDDRIIDLSFSAARQIEMIGPGTAPVRVEVLDPGDREPIQIAAPPPPVIALPTPHVVAAALPPAPRPQSPRPMEVEETAPTAARYAVQVGAFDDYQRARRMQRSLESQGARARLGLVEEGGMRYYRLRIGPFVLQDDAARTVERINALGYPALIVADRAVWQ